MRHYIAREGESLSYAYYAISKKEPISDQENFMLFLKDNAELCDKRYLDEGDIVLWKFDDLKPKSSTPAVSPYA